MVWTGASMLRSGPMEAATKLLSIAVAPDSLESLGPSGDINHRNANRFFDTLDESFE